MGSTSRLTPQLTDWSKAPRQTLLCPSCRYTSGDVGEHCPCRVSVVSNRCVSIPCTAPLSCRIRSRSCTTPDIVWISKLRCCDDSCCHVKGGSEVSRRRRREGLLSQHPSGVNGDLISDMMKAPFCPHKWMTERQQRTSSSSSSSSHLYRHIAKHTAL